MTLLEHGGNLREAIAGSDRLAEDWIDLSTGINPHAYPAPALPAHAWHRLPEPSPALDAAARAYYRAPAVLAVAGTQAAIQALPHLVGSGRVVVSAPSYAEHAHAWRRGGHAVREVPYEHLDAALGACEIMVVCNPNNPTGACIAPEVLLRWAVRLAARGGWLVVDEAFGDTDPDLSVAAHSGEPGLIVLRSVGKFFGLAGLRLGFVAAHEALLSRLQAVLGPWCVSGPAQEIGCAALVDTAWQRGMRAQLTGEGARLYDLLATHAIRASGTALFQWWWCSPGQAAAMRQHMAAHGIWVRFFSGGAGGIRIGLPPYEAAWQRLAAALASANFIKEIE